MPLNKGSLFNNIVQREVARCATIFVAASEPEGRGLTPRARWEKYHLVVTHDVGDHLYGVKDAS